MTGTTPETAAVYHPPTTPPTVKPRNPAMQIVALMLGYTAAYMDTSMITMAIIPIGHEFSLNTAQTGLIISFFFLAFTLIQVPSGWLADKIGPKRILLIGVAIMGLTAVIFSFVSLLMIFIIVRFFSAFGQPAYINGVAKSVSVTFAANRRMFVQSLMLSTYGIGGIVAFTLGGWLIGLNWRTAYLVLGAIYALAFLAILFFVPGHIGRPKTAAAAPKAPKIKYRQVLKMRLVWTFAISQLLIGFVSYGMTSWLPTYLSKHFDLTVQNLGYIMAINSGVCTVVMILSGWLLTKYFANTVQWFMFATILAAGAFAVVLAFSQDLVISSICLILVLALEAAAFTALTSWPMKLINPAIIGESLGIINGGGSLAGVIAPAVLGAVIAAAGGSFVVMFIVIAVIAVLTAVSALLIRGGHHHDASVAPTPPTAAS